jgi:hypothetical protein
VEEVENESIDRTGLSVDEAARRFRRGESKDGKSSKEDVLSVLTMRSIEAKDQLQIRKRALYRTYLSLSTAPGSNVPAGEFELLPHEPTLKETPIQKLRRLMFEAQELGEDVAELMQTKEGEADNMKNSVILAQVSALRHELDNINRRLVESQVDDADDKDAVLLKQAIASRRLLERLQKIRADEQSNDTAAAAAATTEAEEEKDLASDITRAAQLEARIAALERLLGPEDSSAPRLTDPIAPTVARLEERLQLITQPRQMEVAVRRAKTLANELERLQSLKAKDAERTGISEETEKQIETLFNTLDQLDPLIALAPTLVDRLKSLQLLHARAAKFSEALIATEREQARLSDAVKDAADQTSKLEATLKENDQVIQRNIEALDKRINDLLNRVAKLNV